MGFDLRHKKFNNPAKTYVVSDLSYIEYDQTTRVLCLMIE